MELPTTQASAARSLELTIVERVAEDPLMGFYCPSPLHPGAWAATLDGAGLPATMRRLTEPLLLGGRRRPGELRCLPMLPALAWLLGEERPPESASVRAWRLVARLVDVMTRSGGELPDLSRFAAAFPPTAHAVLRMGIDVEHDEGGIGLSAHEAVTEFLAAATRALAAAVAEPRRLAAPDAHADVIDLSVLQPALRAVAPDVGAAAPVVQLRDTLEPLALRLETPPPGADAWTLAVEHGDGGRIARAARIFPPLARSAGGIVVLMVEEVAELRLAAPALEFAGARLEMPPELTEAGGLDLDVAELTIGGGEGAGLGALVAYDVRAALGGRQVSEAEFRALAAATQPLVRLGGQWRVLDQTALRRARALASLALHGQALPAMTALGAALAGRADIRGLEFEVALADGEGGLGELIARLRGDELRHPADPAPGFHGILRPYQAVGLGWLIEMRRLGLGACLADDMGLGKTVQLIAYLLDRGDESDAPTLIVGPTSVIGNWEHELRRFAPDLTLLLHHGPARTSSSAPLEDVDVVVTSYALLARDRALLGRVDWRAVVLDEAQAIKNPLTRGAQAARSLRAGHRIAMTGTPIENRLEELWSIVHFLNPGLLDTRTAFRRRYATPIERRADEEAAERLRAVTGPFILRRHKTDPDVLPDLPPRLDSTQHCTLTLEQAALYQATLDAMLGRVSGTAGVERRAQVLTLLTRLKQVCNHPAQALGGAGPLANRSGKLDRLVEMLDEVVDRGESALVFTQYAVMANLLADHVSGTLELERMLLDGSTARSARDRLVSRFQEDDGPPRVLVMSLRAGGLGLNLTNATHVFHFDRWWNPAVEDQASDRAHRIGQTRVVEVHRLICAGTVEERIDAIIEGKRDLARRIIDRGAESALSELGDDELRELVELRA